MTPQLVAHRGWPLHYPENTLPGIAAAVAAGAQFLEVDVQLSADGVPVLFHDRTLDRVCGVQGAVHQLSLRSLRELSPAEVERLGDEHRGVRIATLAELVTLLEPHSTVQVFVEVKRLAIEQHNVEPVLEAVHSAVEPLGDRATLISFDRRLVQLERAAGRAAGFILEHWGDAEKAASLLFVNHEKVPPGARLDQLGAPVAVYETIDSAFARELGSRGATFVETFAIGEMLASLGGQAP